MSQEVGAAISLCLLLVAAYFAGRGDGYRVARHEYEQALKDAHDRMDRIIRGL